LPGDSAELVEQEAFARAARAVHVQDPPFGVGVLEPPPEKLDLPVPSDQMAALEAIDFVRDPPVEPVVQGQRMFGGHGACVTSPEFGMARDCGIVMREAVMVFADDDWRR
jgi:hypothetical protein